MPHLEPILASCNDPTAVADPRTWEENAEDAASGCTNLISVRSSSSPDADLNGSGRIIASVAAAAAHHQQSLPSSTAGATEGGNSIPPSDVDNSRSLYHPSDRESLSELVCLVRNQIEVFVSTENDVAMVESRDGRGFAVEPGRVGIRCRWCCGPSSHSSGIGIGVSSKDRRRRRLARGAISYPASVRLVYQSARNFQRFHLLECPAVPDDVKRDFNSIKSRRSRGNGQGKGRSKNDSVVYWEEHCRSMGMVDTDRGIVLRRGWTLQSSLQQSASAPNSSSDAVPVEEEPGSEPLCTSLLPFDPDNAKGDRSLLAADDPIDNSPPADTMERRAEHDKTHSSGTTATAEGPPPPLRESPPPLKFLPCGTHHPDTSSLAVRTDEKTETVLEKVRLARAIVASVARISPLGGEDDLRFMGKELYELFSERELPSRDEPRGGDGSDGNGREDEDEESVARHHWSKRGKGGKEAVVDVPLVEMGIPPALCRLVSCLLSHRHRGEGRRYVEYRSITEVEADLRLMADEPERYLFRSPTGDLHVHGIYGREREMAALLGAYDRAAATGDGGRKTNNVVLVSGYSGAGKSSLVHSAGDLLIQRGACFVSGKFDAMRQLCPLSAIVSALDSYYGILAWDEDRVMFVREAVSAVIGAEGASFLASLMPNLRRIMGGENENSPPPIQVGDLRRLTFLFRLLLRTTCSPAHPLVLFLDDLQWADDISLELTQAIVMDTDVRGLFFIGAYRENSEVVGSSDHPNPLATLLDCIRRAQSVHVTSIHIADLDLSSVNSLFSDVLCATPRTTRSLSAAILRKTGGNALFLVQLLSSLRDEGLLRFSLASRLWEWDMDRINERHIADNVVDLMTAKLMKLPPEVQRALSVAAAFGAQCQDVIFQILDRAQDDSITGIGTGLGVAVSEGLVIKTESACRFSHDQIQHAAYRLIPEPDREFFHLKVGRLLWMWSSSEEMKDYLFIVIDQLHRGSRLITDPNEKVRLAQLSLMAGKRASEMSSFLPASAFLKAGINLLVESDWDCHRELCLDLHNSCAEIEYILGDFDMLKRNLDVIFSRARTLQEKLRAYNTLAKSTFSQNNAIDAINTSVAVLGQLGESFPDSVSNMLVKQELVMTQTHLSMQTEDALFHLEVMHDREKQQAMQFLCLMILWVYLEKKEYLPLVACRMVRLSLLHGVCKESAYGFAMYGMLMIGHLGDISGGYHYGKVALSLLEKFRDKEHLAEVYLSVYGAINSWVEPIQSSLPLLKESICVGFAAGDIYHAMVNSHSYAVTAMCAGQPLEPLFEEMKLRSRQMIEHEQHHTYTAGKPLRQATLNLLGRSVNPIKLIGEEMDEENLLSTVEDVGMDALNNVFFRQTYFYRMYLEYLFGEYELAWETAQKNRDIAKHFVARFPMVCGYSFYSGLVALALARQNGKTKYADAIGKSIEHMEKWASSSQWNCQHKLELLTAEYLYLEGDIIGAAEAYNSAVANAAKHSFINEEALASERAGLFYLESGVPSSASAFFKRAYDCYTKWGARAKAAHVQVHYM